MLRFLVFNDGKPPSRLDLTGAYLVGSDGVPLRADIEYEKGEIICRKRAPGPAGLAVKWPIDGCGSIFIETARLIERDKPYVLQQELVRGRLMRTAQKREDWGLFDIDGLEEHNKNSDRARDLLIEALKAKTPEQAAELSQQALTIAVKVGEALAEFHADFFLTRRRQTGGFPRHVFGCRADVNATSSDYRQKMEQAFDFVTIPFSWRQIEPEEQKFNWGPIDSWVDWLRSRQLPIKGSPLVSFRKEHIPDWVYIWEHDFETIRDLVYEHVKRIINRYGQHIHVWDVISGIHAENSFSFSFDQLMELTRMAASLTKTLAPRASCIIDLVGPWGEYYARNQRTIPPMLYADMVVQSGITFDAFALQFFFGPPSDGSYVRDMFQISSLIDRFIGLGKPVHVSAVSVPSDSRPDQQDATGGEFDPNGGGIWRAPWSPEIQQQWLEKFYEVALSKPFVETVTWHDLADLPGHYLPHGGLLDADLNPKPAYEYLKKWRETLQKGNSNAA
jgi:hypothetical protein